MKVIVTVFILLSISIATSAQSSFRVKLFYNIDNFEQTSLVNYNEVYARERLWNFQRFAIGAEFGKRNSLKHQVELFFPQISRPMKVPGYPLNYDIIYGRPYESTAFALRYELLKRFGEKSDPIHFSFGIGLNPYYQKTVYPRAVTLTGAPRQTERFGAVINVVPAIEIKLAERFAFDLSIPVKTYDLRYHREQVKHSSIPKPQQTNGDFEHIFFETAFTLRVGLIYAMN